MTTDEFKAAHPDYLARFGRNGRWVIYDDQGVALVERDDEPAAWAAAAKYVERNSAAPALAA